MHDSPEPHSSTTDTSRQEWIEEWFDEKLQELRTGGDVMMGDTYLTLTGIRKKVVSSFMDFILEDYAINSLNDLIRQVTNGNTINSNALDDHILEEMKKHYTRFAVAAYDEAHTVDFY